MQTGYHRDMSNDTVLKLLKEIRAMRTELSEIRSVIIPTASTKDPEGEYRPEFIKEVMADLKRKPTHTFKNAKQFLRDIAREK